jgi:hypothetical protein
VYDPDEQQAGHRAGYIADTESFYDQESVDGQEYHEGPHNEQSGDSSIEWTLFNSTGGFDSDGSTSSEPCNSGTGDTKSKQQPEDSQLLETESDRLSRALATLDGYQGTEPGPEEDKNEEVESSEEEDEGMKALREGAEPAWPGSQQWKRQMNRRKSKSKRKLKQGK